MKNRGMKIKHPKLRGEWVELRFRTCSAEHGLCVTKPWGDGTLRLRGRKRGAVCASAGEVNRVQGSPRLLVYGTRQLGPYSGDPFDFVAAYLIPEDLWYIIPAEKFQGAGEYCPVSPAEEFQVR